MWDESGGVIPLPTPVVLEALRNEPVVWTRAPIGEIESRIAYFGGGPTDGTVFALTYPLPVFSGNLATFLRLFLLNTLIAGLLSGLFWIGRAVRIRRLPSISLGTTFYGRLTAQSSVCPLQPVPPPCAR